jgi:ferric-dicitrate binding protein FerR (iron transport regulator)
MGNNGYDKDIAAIILKSAYTSLTPAEQEMLSQYLNASEANLAKYAEMTRADNLQEKLAHYAKRDANKEIHFHSILQQVKKKTPVYPFYIIKKYSWAAAILLLVAGAWFFKDYRRQNKVVPGNNTTTVPTDVLPGKRGAVLTLADGSHLVLDSLGNGIVADQQGAKVVLQNGQVQYDIAGAGKEELVYNTLSTPKGREFKVILPDGSQVWLNSYSSIRYPLRFNSKERVVYITGEVYFEVAGQLEEGSKTKTPFIVKISTPDGEAGMVKVLGTHFNINAYGTIYKTTLLEGSVKVASMENDETVTLKPGQQAIASLTSRKAFRVDRSPDIDKVMAWRRGFFNFDDAPLDEVMQQLARWYDIEVEYASRVPDITFEGELSRQMKLSGVLQALEESKVHFIMEGRKIIIQP